MEFVLVGPLADSRENCDCPKSAIFILSLASTKMFEARRSPCTNCMSSRYAIPPAIYKKSARK